MQECATRIIQEDAGDDNYFQTNYYAKDTRKFYV